MLEKVKNHIIRNYKEYVIIVVFFVVGIFCGVFLINKSQENQVNELRQYLETFINQLKNTSNLNYMQILKTSLLDEVYLTIAIWFFATTVVGVPIVFGLVAYRGFCLGYTISALILCMGFNKGFPLVLVTLVLQNIIFIPLLIGLAASGFKFYKSIVKDRRRENIKISFIRHTIFSAIILIGLCLSSVIEVFISTNLLKLISVYF